MRLQKLYLSKFGPFTDQVLDLSQGKEGLHVLWGPNEAGKSSALRAVESLLYGLSRDDRDAFLHPKQKLEIHADILLSSLSMVRVSRFPGRDKVIVEWRDTAHDDHSDWNAALRGVDQAAFQRMFGLNQSRLSEGGRELARGHGDLGEILFSAAGQTDLREIQDRISNQLQKMFKKKGRNQELPKLFQQYQFQKKALRDQVLSHSKWQAFEQELDRLREQRRSVDELRRGLEARRRELQSLKSAKEQAHRRAELREVLQSLRSVPRLDPEFSNVRIEAQRRLAITGEQIRGANEQLQEIARQKQTLQPNHEILKRVGIIEYLYRQLGEVEEKTRQLAKLEVERESQSIVGSQLLSELGISESLLKTQTSMRLRTGDAEDIRRIGQALTDVERRRQDAQDELRTVSQDLCEYQPAELAPDLNNRLDLLNGLLHELRAETNGEEELRQVTDSLARMEEQIIKSVKRLGLRERSLRQVRDIEVPTEDVIDRLEPGLIAINQRLEVLRTTEADLERHLLDCQQRIKLVDPTDSIPTEARLEAIRADRELVWREIEQVFEGMDNSVDEEMKVDKRSFSLLHLFHRAHQLTIQADAMADRLRHEADRVQEKLGLQDQARRLGEQIHGVRESIRAADADRENWLQRWNTAWQIVEDAPGCTKDGRAFIRKWNSMVSSLDDLEHRRRLSAQRQDQLQSLRERIVQCLPSDNGTEFGKELKDLLSPLQEAVHREGKRIEEQRDREKEFQRLARVKRQLQGKLAALEEQRVALKGEWGSLVSRLAIPAETSVDAAAARLEALQKYWRIHDRIEELTGTIKRETDERNAFVEQMAALRAVFPAPNLTDPQLIEQLLEEAREAKKQVALIEALAKQEIELENKRRPAEADQKQARILITSLCEQADASSPDELAEVEEKAQTRLQVERELSAVETALNSMRGRLPLDEFCEKSVQLNETHAELELLQLEPEVQASEQQLELLGKQIWELEQAKLVRSNSPAAADTAQELQIIYAQMEAKLREFQKLRLAAGILQFAVEQYRQKNEDRIVRRSSQLFRQLTCHRYAGVELESANDGQITMIGRRIHDNMRVGIEAMSDGTRDQLYFALRIATLEAFLDVNEPIPFIADDLLINFDDERAIAALQVLGEFSQRSQVLFFTHHRHLVELARDNLSSGTVFEHSINSA